MSAIIQKRRDTAARWALVNPVLADGEEGYETDTGKSKVGNGITAWASLAYTQAGTPTSRTIAAGTGLTGGGDLTTDRTLSVTYGTTATTAARGDDARITSARIPAGRAWTFLGDSITNGANADPGLSYPYIAISCAGGTARVANLRHPATPGSLNPPAGALSVVLGYPGEDSGQILARFDTEVPPTKPGGIFAMVGTNDFGRNTLTQWQNNIKSLRAKTRALGIPLVLGTIPPVGAGTTNATTRRAYINAQNLWLRQWAPAHDVPLADTHRAMIDPATGWIRSDHNGDDIHPVNAGHAAMGRAVGPALAAAGRAAVPLIAAAGVGVNPNPLMSNGTSNPAGGPTGYGAVFGSTMTTPGYACVDPVTGSTLAAGKWAELDCTATTGGFTGLTRGLSGLTAGGLCALVGQVELEDVTGGVAAAVAGTAGWGVSVQSDNGSQLYAAFSAATGVWEPQPGPHLVLFRLPTGITTCKVEWKCSLPTGTRVKFRLGCLDVLDLTALGIENLGQ